MNSALLHNGNVVTAVEYNPDVHGNRIYCIDNTCQTPVIFVNGSESTVPHFKTTGKNSDSKHHEQCGFARPLTFEESIKKVEEFQQSLMDKGIKEIVIRMNMNKIDPDYESKQIEREESEKKPKDASEVKIKQESTPPNSIGSLKAIVKLLTSYEPDTLASILVNVKGKKVPISQLIISHDKAHELLWEDRTIPSLNYFVFGTVEKLIRREKVYYINFKPVNDVMFSLVIFDKYFKHFTYTDEQLIGKNVLATGLLKKNVYKDKNTTEMVIKSNKYLELIGK
ncbi:hypothetical protein D1B31_18500 [Neobacillus notoginsengisoli]|uniref:Uncharacterized protein n=1 Tax=Neobacillus notoginsengisoli TaxID=1578198 RepID=A0A417YQB6_9BACI|nr:hypothetical protein [Neobacillus notoginsengisoli]RHW36069.1 hypothetical protein D1B31_18500 [Neobacillus notoginsengisoli]